MTGEDSGLNLLIRQHENERHYANTDITISCFHIVMMRSHMANASKSEVRILIDRPIRTQGS